MIHEDDDRDIEYVGRLIDAYAAAHPPVGVAEEDEGDGGVPRAMWAGSVDEEGWVPWRVLPSTLTPADVSAVEAEFGVAFPPLFRAYLLCRFQLFDQLRSTRWFDRPVLMTPVPPVEPLSPLRELLRASGSLLRADYIPFGQWGDAEGPMCFDARWTTLGDELAIVWLDHEALAALGEADLGRREKVKPMAQPLYMTFRGFLEDVFLTPS